MKTKYTRLAMTLQVWSIIALLCMGGFAYAQAPFDQTYTMTPSPGWWVHQSIAYAGETPDGGFIGAGNYNSTGAGWTSDWYITLWRTDASGSVIWSDSLIATYEGEGTHWVVADASVTDDGGLYVLYKKHVPGYSFNGVLKINSGGDIVWNTPLTSIGLYASGNLRSIETTDDNGCITAGATSYFPSLPLMIKVDAAGAIDWTTDYFMNDIGWNTFYDVTQAEDGGYIGTGIVHNNPEGKYQMLVSKVDASGLPLWESVFNSGSYTSGDSILSEGYAVAATPDGGCLATGYQTIPGSYPRSAFLVRIDADGESIWTKNEYFDVAGNAVGKVLLKNTDGNYLWMVSSNSGFTDDDPRLVKISSDGSIIWDQHGYQNYYGWDLWLRSITESGMLVFSGSTSVDHNYAKLVLASSDGLFRAPVPFTPTDGTLGVPEDTLLTINDDLSIHWFEHFIYQVAADSEFTNITIDAANIDNDSLFITDLAPNTLYYWRIAGTGAEGDTSPWSAAYTFTTGDWIVQDVNSGFAEDIIAVGPNPFYGNTYLFLNLHEAGAIDIEVFDMLGKGCGIIYSGVLAAGDHVLPYQHEGPSGMYLVRIMQNGIAVGSISIVAAE